MTRRSSQNSDSVVTADQVDGQPVVSVTDLHTSLASQRGQVRALEGVSLTIEAGRTLGVVGESGCGKSILVRSIMGLLPDNATRTGEVLYAGQNLVDLEPRRVRSLWGTDIAMVPQDPMTSLNPVRRIGVQLIEPLRLHLSLDKPAARRRALELLNMVGLPDAERRLSEYPHQLSGGMRQRVIIAAALAADPKVLLADEPTTALDVTVQAQILALLRRLQQNNRMGMVLVTHDLGVVAGCTDHVLVMYAGRVVESAPTRVLFQRMRMPYTEALFASIPRLGLPTHTRLAVIPGRPPDPIATFTGCRFAPRCQHAQDKCHLHEPPLTPSDEPHHYYRCWYPIDRSAACSDAPVTLSYAGMGA